MDTVVPGSPGPELKEYTALLRRRWRMVAAGVAGGAALALAGVLAVPASYTSTAAVQVLPTGMAEFTGEKSGRLAGDVNLDTEAQVLRSEEVSAAAAALVAEATGSPATADGLRENVDVTVPPNSNVLEIHYTAGSPEAARAGAAAYSEAYLDRRAERVDGLIGAHLEALGGERERLEEELGRVIGASGAADPRAEAVRQDITSVSGSVAPLAALRETVEPGRTIIPADLPERASSPNPPLWLAAGTALGLLAGLGAAVLRDRTDRRLHDVEETERLGGLPVLLDLSACRPERGGRTPGLLGEDRAGGQRVQSLVHLIRARSAGDAGRTPAAGGEGPRAGRVLVVAATTPGRAGTAAAVNVAAALARTGSETLLVCADPRSDTVGELLGLPEGPGLAEALVDGEDPAGLEVRPEAAPRLRVLRHGRPGAAAPVQDTAMADLLGLLREQAEHVVVAVPPPSERADVHAVAGAADLLLPVVELDRTPRAELAELTAAAERFSVDAPGVIVLPRQPLPGPPPEAAPAAGAPAAGRDGTERSASGIVRVSETPAAPDPEAPEEESEDEETVVVPADSAGARR
ncbi:chain length determinant family protein [Nocardiopsis changdeensis]|uniref:Chain length determinant family protein n=1 Tax=Nocardiopsis changdeensis TaxID=2831969 RepID=A0ABX8BPN2_9ACTN|nr:MULTISPECIES: chain length determinant family protein [Nocardiopsis]QUX23658.1 chain length determinant family protein [Nocardiopsis changdeensis]QYX39601.1 chain length determinant family protein [Nocardiopsis sp. MT53]